ncbi:PglL family O-oligosaccharyltransferase [Azoarcus taiwanensis]|uniref:Virulence factor membrane-bound polymerase C-terminal domain-containing protein n=1 Tax=Azoarcus taiwanensis TaxID=666964 RepID=A0A972FI60_9RHOO|nr:Wzy polymerase domain-containing protein [Azoarcus taiwanensis]NMG05190.1 hypothetical protein [Azoarcus taiwanensis]
MYKYCDGINDRGGQKIFDRSLWCSIAAVVIACAWLLPNHHLPWLSFHSDAWIAVSLAVVTGVLLVFNRARVYWTKTAFVVLLAIALVFGQYFFGAIIFAGDMWVSLLYLGGLLVALLISDSLVRQRQWLLVDVLFGAIGVAAIISVGLQLYQWFGMTRFGAVTDIWVLDLVGGRPYANLGQPNQLATLLVWGLVAIGWAALRGVVRTGVFLMCSTFILFGLALTQSRTAWLVVICLVVGAWIFRRAWSNSRTPLLITVLGGLFFLFVFSIEPISRLLYLEGYDLGGRASAGLVVRPLAWWMFLDAIFAAPWFGYGWNQTLLAQVAVIDSHEKLYGLSFSQAHNLLVDLLVWTGIPLGLMLIVALVVWYIHVFKKIESEMQVLLLFAVTTVGVHAMLEFPLHYAYFLLPTGVFVGSLCGSLQQRALFVLNWKAVAFIWLVCALGLAITVHEYLKIEENFFALRFEMRRIGTGGAAATPEVFMLDQLRENLRFARLEIDDGVDGENLAWMRRVVNRYPSALNMTKFSEALGRGGEHEEATYWLGRICMLVSEDECAIAQRVWLARQEEVGELAGIQWPPEFDSEGNRGQGNRVE